MGLAQWAETPPQDPVQGESQPGPAERVTSSKGPGSLSYLGEARLLP